MRVRDDFEGGDDNQDRLPGARAEGRRRPRRARQLPLRRARRPRRRDGRRGAAAACSRTSGSDVVDTKLYITGGCGALYDGASPDGYPWQERDQPRPPGLRPRLPAAAHDGPHRVVREHRHDPVERADAGAHGRGALRRRDRADRLQRLLAGISLDGTAYFYTNPLRQVRDLPLPAADAGRHRACTRSPSRPRRMPVCAEPTSAASAARRTSRARSPASTSARHRRAPPTALYVHLYGGSEHPTSRSHDGRAIAPPRESDYPWGERIAFTVTEAAGGGMPLHLRVPGWVDGADAHRERRAAAESSTPGALRHDRAATGRPATSWCSTLPMPRADAARPPPRRGARRTRSRSARPGRLRRRERTTCPTGVHLEQVALRRGAELSPVEIELDGQPLVALEGEVASCCPPGDEALYADVERRRPARHPDPAHPLLRVGQPRTVARCRSGSRWSGDHDDRRATVSSRHPARRSRPT